MIIDSHIHCPLFYEDKPGFGRELVRKAEKYGISVMLMSNVIGGGEGSGDFPNASYVRRANDYVALQAEKNPGRIYYQVYINPQLPNWREELARGIKKNAIGVKLWISLKNANGGFEETCEVLQAINALNLPVLFHCYNRTDENRAGEIDIAEMAWLSRKFPDCKMIVGHLGGNWRESAGMYKYFSNNVYFDICGGYPEQGTLEKILEEYPAEKILFGSDKAARNFVTQLQKITNADITESQKELILWKNAQKLYNLTIPKIGKIAPAKNPLPLPEGDDEDHYCFSGKYPFYSNYPDINSSELESILHAEGIKAAYTADFNAIFGSDLLAANLSFLASCKGLERVKPLAVINPRARNLAALLDAALTEDFAAVWLSPILHRWRLNDAKYQQLFERCADAGKTVYINFSLGDMRFRHIAQEYRIVSPEEFEDFIKNAPANNYILQGSHYNKIPENKALSCKQTITHLSDYDEALVNHMLQKENLQLCWGSEFPLRKISQTKEAAITLLTQNDRD